MTGGHSRVGKGLERCLAIGEDNRRLDLAIGAQHIAKVNLSGPGDINVTGPGVCTVTRSGSGDVNCTHYSKD